MRFQVSVAARRRALGAPTDLAPQEIEALAQAWIAEDAARRLR